MANLTPGLAAGIFNANFVFMMLFILILLIDV